MPCYYGNKQNRAIYLIYEFIACTLMHSRITLTELTNELHADNFFKRNTCLSLHRFNLQCHQLIHCRVKHLWQKNSMYIDVQGIHLSGMLKQTCSTVHQSIKLALEQRCLCITVSWMQMVQICWKCVRRTNLYTVKYHTHVLSHSPGLRQLLIEKSCLHLSKS